MSRVARRGSAASSNRRTTKSGGSARNIPWVPIGVAVLIFLAVAGLVLYLVLQSDNSPADPNAEARVMELDPAPDLQGEYVNLPSAFAENGKDAGYHLPGGPDTATHVQAEVDFSKETSANSSTGYPPAGGPHWGSTACGEDPASAPQYCGPVPWGIYREEWPEESVVHNMEHGGVVIWYNTADTAVRDNIETEALKYNDRFVVVMPYSNMPENTIALTAWARRDLFPTSEFSADRIDSFIETFTCRFNPENFSCGSM